MDSQRPPVTIDHKPSVSPAGGNHVQYKQLEAYVENRLTPEQRSYVDEHLRLCFECKREADDLALFRKDIQPPHVRLLTPGRILTGTLVIVGFVIVFGSIRLLSHSPEVPPEYAPAVNKAIAQGFVDVPREVIALSAAPSLRVITEPTFRLHTPYATAVATTKPEFSWEALPDKSRYTVSIFDVNHERVDHSAPLNETTWHPTVDLKEGATYDWQVRAESIGRITVAPPEGRKARFRILTSQEAKLLDQTLREVRGNHLVSGILNANYGILDEAEKELDKAGSEGGRALAYVKNLRAR